MSRLIALVAFLAVSGLAGTGHATHRFCPKWAFSFTDQGIGEDYLVHNTGPTTGKIAASRSYAVLQKNGTTIWEGLLNESGCTPDVSSTTAATFKLMVTAAIISKPVDGGDAIFRVWKELPRQIRWFTWQQQLPAGAGQRFHMTIGDGDPISAVAAVVVHLLSLPDVILFPGETNIQADHGCPFPGTSCFTLDNGIFLGTASPSGAKDAFVKTTVAHEIGHAMMFRMMGELGDGDGDVVSTIVGCNCDHVANPNNRSHCLQSLEAVGAAIEEGWAQFFAADAFNIPSEPDAYFAYYKEFLLPGYGVFSPPVAMRADLGWKWNIGLCSFDFERSGVELDWMTFLYELNNRGAWAFTYHDIRQIFRRACGGVACSTQKLAYSSLLSEVIKLYGAGSPKANHFTQTASKHIKP